MEKVLLSKLPWLNAHWMLPEPGVMCEIQAGENEGRELSQNIIEWAQYSESNAVKPSVAGEDLTVINSNSRHSLEALSCLMSSYMQWSVSSRNRDYVFKAQKHSFSGSDGMCLNLYLYLLCNHELSTAEHYCLNDLAIFLLV